MVMLVGQGKKFEIWGQPQWDMARDSWLEEDAMGHRNSDDLPPELKSLSL